MSSRSPKPHMPAALNNPPPASPCKRHHESSDDETVDHRHVKRQYTRRTTYSYIRGSANNMVPTANSATASPARDPENEMTRPIPSMKNEELESSIRIRLPHRSRSNSRHALPSAQETGIMHDLTEGTAFWNHFTQMYREMEALVTRSSQLRQEVSELSERLNGVKLDLSGMTQHAERFLVEHSLVLPAAFSGPSANINEARDPGSFAEGGFHNPMRIDDEEN